MKVYEVSAFSKDNIGGNKAGVIIKNQVLSHHQKQKVASKLGYSETVFVSTNSLNREVDYKLEYYTPTQQIELFGHATIATFVLLKLKNLLIKNNYKIQTLSGVLDINIDDNIFMEVKNPFFGKVIDKKEIENCFESNAIDNKLDCQIVSTGVEDIIVAINDCEYLKNMNVNLEKIELLSKKLGVCGIHAYAIDNNNIYTRNFAPYYGINEESATGTANSALACFLYKNNLFKKECYTFNQGQWMGLPSQIKVKLITKNDEISKVFVGGKGYINKEFEIEI